MLFGISTRKRELSNRNLFAEQFKDYSKYLINTFLIDQKSLTYFFVPMLLNPQYLERLNADLRNCLICNLIGDISTEAIADMGLIEV